MLAGVRRPRWIAGLSAGGLIAVMSLAMAQDQISPPPGFIPPPPPTGIVPPALSSGGSMAIGDQPPAEDQGPSLRGSSASQSPMDIGITPPVASGETLPDGTAPADASLDPQEAPPEATDNNGLVLELPAPAGGEAASVPQQRDELRPGGTVAVLRGLDKITARVTVVNAPIGKPVPFGKLKIVADYCYKRPPEEPPEATAFVQIDDVREADPVKARIFSGWMFASSPALHAVEHPVYDVWLIDCKASTPESEFGRLPKEPTVKEDDSKHIR